MIKCRVCRFWSRYFYRKEGIEIPAPIGHCAIVGKIQGRDFYLDKDTTKESEGCTMGESCCDIGPDDLITESWDPFDYYIVE